MKKTSEPEFLPGPAAKQRKVTSWNPGREIILVSGNRRINCMVEEIKMMLNHSIASAAKRVEL